MQSGVYHQARRSPNLGLQMAISARGILVQPQVENQGLGVKRPTLAEGDIAASTTKLGQIAELGRAGGLQMMSRDTFVGCQCLLSPLRPVLVPDRVDVDPAGARSVERWAVVILCRVRPGRSRHRSDSPG